MKIVGRIASYWRLFRLIQGNRWLISTLLSIENLSFLRFATPGHFYSPFPGSREVEAMDPSGPDADSIPGVDLRETEQLALLDGFAAYYREMDIPEQQEARARYYFDNRFYSYGDGVVLYCMLRHFRPRRIVEVGSGFSSSLMLDVNDRYFDGKIAMTFIEPEPERLLSLVDAPDRAGFRLFDRPVQEVSLEVFSQLESGDILFIDSSHVVKFGSDLAFLLFQVLPILKRGVLVHLHDIPWPFEYPKQWLRQGRAWNEAYFLRAFLQYNGAFDIVYFNSYVEKRHRERLAAVLPSAARQGSAFHTLSNSSLWLRKR